jgi:hypothetical protein
LIWSTTTARRQFPEMAASEPERVVKTGRATEGAQEGSRAPLVGDLR